MSFRAHLNFQGDVLFTDEDWLLHGARRRAASVVWTWGFDPNSLQTLNPKPPLNPEL